MTILELPKKSNGGMKNKYGTFYFAFIFSRNYTLQLLMYRVLLRVDRVSLKIKQTVQMHVLIRKDHRHLIHCKNEYLRNGESRPVNSSQFYIQSRNPRFQIEILLVFGQMKKKGGVVPINLHSFQLNDSHRIVEQIKKTPTAGAIIQLDLIYMRSECIIPHQSLISLHKMQEFLQSKQFKEINDQHQKLLYHNNRLNQQIKNLRDRNNVLQRQRSNLEKDIFRNEEDFHKQLSVIEGKKEEYLSNLKVERKKVQGIVRAINDYGDLKLKNQMEKIVRDANLMFEKLS